MQPAAVSHSGSGLDVFELLTVAVAQRHFHEAQLLDVAGDRRLRDFVTLLLEQVRELFLRTNRPGCDQRENRTLSLGFHTLVILALVMVNGAMRSIAESNHRDKLAIIAQTLLGR